MTPRSLLKRFEAIVRLRAPLAAGASALALTAGCATGDGSDFDPHERAQSYESQGFATSPVQLGQQDYEELLATFKRGESIPLDVCRRVCERLGGEQVTSCNLPLEADGEEPLTLMCTVEYRYFHPVGRRPPGLLSAAQAEGATACGRWFAESARLEEGAVLAFAALLDELRAHGAPQALQEACLQALWDEVHHTHLTRALALALGADPRRPEVEEFRVRPLLEIALDNAVEGCVQETWSALQATWQAHFAQPGPIQQALAAIAVDETRHAELSWDIDAWIMTRLDEGERQQVIDARAEAVAALRRALASVDTAPLPAALGLPDSAQALDLFDTLSADLLAA